MKKEDVLHKYVYIEDADGKEVPSWNFISKIAVAENCEPAYIYDEARKNNYKLFRVEAYAFWREIVAAKEITAEDIMEDYGEFLQGTPVIYEVECECY